MPMVLRSMQKQLQQPGWASNWQLIGNKMFGGYASPEMQRTLHEMTPEELEKLIATAGKPTGATSETQEKFQDFISMLERTKTEVENSLAKPLSNLAKPLGNVVTAFGDLAKTIFESPGFKKGTEDFAGWLTKLSEDMKDPEFKKSVSNFITEIGRVITGLARLASWIASFFPDEKGPEGGAPSGDSSFSGQIGRAHV